LRSFAAKKVQTVENDRERLGSPSRARARVESVTTNGREPEQTFCNDYPSDNCNDDVSSENKLSHGSGGRNFRRR
jgi:hypothetical protein